MFHLHIYLSNKLPFINFTVLRNKEKSKYEENIVMYKGATMYESPDLCKVCKEPVKHKFAWKKR
mgnify:FL=1